MINFFKKKEEKKQDDEISVVSLASLLIHAAKIDENYTNLEKKIITETLVELGIKPHETADIMKNAEIAEKDSFQILEYTKQAKNLNENKKKLLIEALWKIIFSDKDADMYEANLMRRLSGLLYLDNKLVGDIKEKIKKEKL